MRGLARCFKVLPGILPALLMAMSGVGCAQVIKPGSEVSIVYPLDGLRTPPSFTLLVATFSWDRGAIFYNGLLDTQPKKAVKLHPVPAWLEVDGRKLRDLPNHMLHRIPIGPLAAGLHRIVLHAGDTAQRIRIQVEDPFPLRFEAVRPDDVHKLESRLADLLRQELNAAPKHNKELCPDGYCNIHALVSGRKVMFYMERADGSVIGWIGQAADSGVKAVLARMRRQPDRADVTMRVANGTFLHACGDGGFLWLEWQDNTYRLVRWINGKASAWQWRERDEQQWARALGDAGYQPEMAYGQPYCQKAHALVHRGNLLLLFDPGAARPRVVANVGLAAPAPPGYTARWLDAQDQRHELGPGRVVSAFHIGQQWWLLRAVNGRLPWLSPLNSPERRLATPVAGGAKSWDLAEFFFRRRVVLPIVGSVASSPREDAPVGLAATPDGPLSSASFVISNASGR